MLKIINHSIFSIVLFSLCFGNIVRAEVIDIDNDTLQSLLDQDIPIVDVRRVDEWNDTGVIDDSHLLTFFDAQGGYDVEKWLSDLDAIVSSDDPFILICRSGNRTRMISQWLSEKQGYARIYNVTDGILSWRSDDGKTVTP